MSAHEIISDETDENHLELTSADMAAYEAEVLKSQQETVIRCKAQAECANSYGGRWQLFIRREDRNDKTIGRCLCDESRASGDILSITIVSDE